MAVYLLCLKLRLNDLTTLKIGHVFGIYRGPFWDVVLNNVREF